MLVLLPPTGPKSATPWLPARHHWIVLAQAAHAARPVDVPGRNRAAQSASAEKSTRASQAPLFVH